MSLPPLPRSDHPLVLTLTRGVLLLAVLLALAPLPAARAASDPQPTSPSQPPQHLITVSGDGAVHAPPDQATVRVGVTAIAPRSTDAMAQVNTSLAAVLGSIAALGIPPRDLQTSGLALQPNYKPRQPGDDSPPQIDSYRATNNVTVTVRDLSQVGPVLDAATANGANSISGVQFGFANEAQLRQQALASATSDALAKAQAIATAAGVGPIALQSVDETSVTVPQPVAFAAAAPAPSGAAPTPVESGEMTVNAHIQATFTF